MSEKSITFKRNGYLLEGVMHKSKAKEKARCVITHPHPLYGGSMDNNVVHALCRALPGEGISCLRFNFGGVGRSQGSFSEGVGEAGELGEAYEFFKKDFSGPVFTAGYSFGAYVALLALQSGFLPAALACVSPPVDFLKIKFPEPESLPLYVVAGANDLYCSQASLEDQYKENNPATIIDNADHFWTGYEKIMVKNVMDFFLNHL